MTHRVALIEFSIYDQYPLVSGYLHAYAMVEADIARSCEFVYFAREVERCTYEETLRDIRALGADILCFSCYVWNMGLVRRLAAELSGDPKVQRIIMGGHQVSHHIERYVEPHNGKVVVINGQGEIPFRAVLRHHVNGVALAGLRGVSVYEDGSLWNGGEAEMLANLDDIPSPYLSGCFDTESHPISIFETNRGCPYKCTFCTWGGDTLRVTKFSLDRLKEELLWLVKRQTLFFYLADANWGMLPRDVELSEYIGRLKQDYGFPFMVYYAAAKNKPKGSVACIEKFNEGGVITSQALGVQSMNDETLALIDRKNIRNSAFLEMFDELKQRQIDSYCELIWPLPGETLDTLGAGFQRLLSLGARTVIMYPAILINNARLTEQIDEHEMEYVPADDWKSELRLVKATKWANRSSVEAGFWLYYAQFVLGNLDRDKVLLKYLASVTGQSYAQILFQFSGYLRAHVGDSEYAGLVASIFRLEEHGSLLTIGRLATHLTHDCRLSAQCDVLRFVVSQTERGVGDRAGHLAVALLWALSMPKLFSDTVDDATGLLALCDQLRGDDDSWAKRMSVREHKRVTTLEVLGPMEVWSEALTWFSRDALSVVSRIAIHHPAVGFSYNRRDLKRNYVYAHGMIQRLSFISPEVTAAGTPSAFGHADSHLDAAGGRVLLS